MCLILLLIIFCIEHLGVYLINSLHPQNAEKDGQSEGEVGKNK
jgi:hypothetical protein